ncbi:thioredoxin domain protein [Rhodopirellula maiorica SM1]|uniref:Thioredoxin domain protein n=1 Tax=Rhodopirellula maiorica SM1 TaxID=1265738 RepID=M5RID8_9BACT|nr:thioredoxin domain protein [Rhodopirellula maiorica SM1]
MLAADSAAAKPNERGRTAANTTEDDSDPAEPATDSAATDSAATDKSADVKWFTDYKRALKKAKQLKRPLLIEFAATWCVPCRIMEKKVWTDDAVQNALKKDVVPLRIDMDAKHAPPLIEKFKVEFVPTILIINDEEEELIREGFVNAEDFLKMVRKSSKKSSETLP